MHKSVKQFDILPIELKKRLYTINYTLNIELSNIHWNIHVEYLHRVYQGSRIPSSSDSSFHLDSLWVLQRNPEQESICKNVRVRLHEKSVTGKLN